MKFFEFLKNSKNSCRINGHDWEVTERSNTIQQDEMGYPLRLCILTCKRCGKSEQHWLDTDISALNEVENGKSVLLEWEKPKESEDRKAKGKRGHGMSICKDCIHYEICDEYVSPCESFPECEGGCKCFKDKAEFVEVRHGEWKICGAFDDFLKCSLCHTDYPWMTASYYNYCPNCGAKMDGERREG